jgi:hypothetical protein
MLNLGARMGKGHFAGTYKLESFEIEENSGHRKPWGNDLPPRLSPPLIGLILFKQLVSHSTELLTELVAFHLNYYVA